MRVFQLTINHASIRIPHHMDAMQPNGGTNDSLFIHPFRLPKAIWVKWSDISGLDTQVNLSWRMKVYLNINCPVLQIITRKVFLGHKH